MYSSTSTIFAEFDNANTYVEIFPQTIVSNEKANVRISTTVDSEVEKLFEITILTPDGKSYKSNLVLNGDSSKLVTGITQFPDDFNNSDESQSDYNTT
ncbi:hypothetical protein, partial [Candidatus Nitrosopumilus salaria]|uniref:hypothetical protein n=1 Tax=Candidatus Nitrosopumilus salarius TaxID=1170320 RepID=UPI0013158DDF